MPATMAQLSASDREIVEAYLSAVTSAESATSPQGIESVFFSLMALRRMLNRVQEDRNTVLESLSETEFLHLKGELPSVLIQRQEIVYVEPNTDYFVRLAAKSGNDADRVFFAALKASYPKSVWPVYIRPQTDYSGCTRFGSMSLVETYRVWSEFRKKYPHRYIAQAKTQVEHVLDKLTTSTCACGDAVGIIQELEQFRKLFPATSVQPMIDTRLESLRDHRSNIRINCQSG